MAALEAEPIEPPQPTEPEIVEPEAVAAPPPAPAIPQRKPPPPKIAEPEPEPEPVQQAEAVEQPAPKPAEPEPEPQEIDLAALLKSVENLDKRVAGDEAVEGQGQQKTDDRVTSLTDAQLVNSISQQIRACWSFPAALNDADDLRPKLTIEFEPTGTARSVQIVDQARLASDPLFRTVAESAQRAVYRCRLDLPAEEYPRWQRVTMNFIPGSSN